MYLDYYIVIYNDDDKCEYSTLILSRIGVYFDNLCSYVSIICSQIWKEIININDKKIY